VLYLNGLKRVGRGFGVFSTAGNSERDSTVTAATSGSGVTRRLGGQRRAAQKKRNRWELLKVILRSGASFSRELSSRIPRTAVSKRGGSGGDVGEGHGGGENARVPAGTALVGAQRILALATESLDMMRNVTSVMKDSLDRAEAWVGRLRTIGIQRDTQVEDADPIIVNTVGVQPNSTANLIRKIYLVHLSYRLLLLFGDLSIPSTPVRGSFTACLCWWWWYG